MGVKLYRWEAGTKSSTIGDKGLIFGTEVLRARKSGLLYTTTELVDELLLEFNDVSLVAGNSESVEKLSYLGPCETF